MPFSFCLSFVSADTLSLHQVLVEALRNNPGHLATRADRRFAEEALSSAGLAGYLPRVAATAGTSWAEQDTRREENSGAVREASDARSVSTTAGVNARWTLFEGFTAPLERDRLRLRRDQARVLELLSGEELLRRAALAYADLGRQASLREARDTVLAISEERVRILDQRLASGTAARPEWLEGQVDRNADRAALLQQEALLHAARLALGAAMGREGAVAGEASREELPSAPLPRGELARGLAERQPALRLAETERELAEVALRQTAALWYPRLEATAGYNFSLMRNDAGNFREARAVGPTAGLQVTVNLFDGELPWRVHRRGRLALDAAGLRLREAEIAVQAEVGRALALWRAADTAAALERQGLAYARENLDLTMLRWRSGTLSYLEARLAQVKYLDAFTRAENAEFEAFRARLDVLRAAGRMDILLDEAAALAAR